MNIRRDQSGFTLLEILVSLMIGALIVTILAAAVSKLTASRTALQEQGKLADDARFAMDRMVRAVRGSRDLILPQLDRPDTDWREHVREETIPASTPEGSSKLATAVLAISLAARIDLDADGFPDADNDRDGLIDEDFPGDSTFDFGPGIYLIDDSGNGSVDESKNNQDDDEWKDRNDEGPINGLDDDGDGVIDEDPAADMNNDGKPGFAGVDDDGDGQVDEGNDADDDEDGSSDEDWLDAVVFNLLGNTLIERHPVPWDENQDGKITGRDFVESIISEDVSRFRVERIAGSGKSSIVDISLDLTGAQTGKIVSLHARVRVGSSQ
jgi:prepilin-type N-terminal cleavage/methylation domain-containing protein